jgi:hypothetical protein
MEKTLAIHKSGKIKKTYLCRSGFVNNVIENKARKNPAIQTIIKNKEFPYKIVLHKQNMYKICAAY